MFSKRQEKAIAVAKDVLKVIKGDKQGGFSGYGSLKSFNGYIFRQFLDSSKPKPDEDFQKYVDKVQPMCTACALSTCLFSHIRLYDRVKVKDIIKEKYPNSHLGKRVDINSKLIIEKLEKTFGRKQLRLIEMAYEVMEGETYYDETDEHGKPLPPNKLIQTDLQGKLAKTRVSNQEAKRAFEFGLKTRKGSKRIAAIMRNIIKNGSFKP